MTQYSYFEERENRRKSLYAVKTPSPFGTDNRKVLTYASGTARFDMAVKGDKPGPVGQMIIDRKTGIKYGAVAEACAVSGLAMSTIRSQLCGSIVNRRFVYTKDYNPDEPYQDIVPQSTCRRVQHIPTGQIYESIVAARREYACSHQTIWSHCQGIVSKPVWRYADADRK